MSFLDASDVGGSLKQLSELLNVGTNHCFGNFDVVSYLSDEDEGGKGVDVEFGHQFVSFFSVYPG